MGVCLDTCHLYAAGYDIATPRGYETTMRRASTASSGSPGCAAMHLNDAKLGLGSRRRPPRADRRGHLGLDTFRRIVNDPRLRGRPHGPGDAGPAAGDGKASCALLRRLRARRLRVAMDARRVAVAADRAAERAGLALEAGFDLAGVRARPRPRPSCPSSRGGWRRGYAGEMAYLTAQASDADRPRGPPFPGRARSSASACSTTRPAPYSTEAPPDRGWIARYAWGDDYHDVMKAMLDRAARSGCAPRRARSSRGRTWTPARSWSARRRRRRGSGRGARTPACSTRSTAPGSSWARW